MSVNLIQNPGFESGVLSPWTPHAANVAEVVASNADHQPAEGDYYLDLQTAVGNGGNTISQTVTGLTPGTTYIVSVQTRTRGEGAANYCGTSIYAGNNATAGSIASEWDTPNEWWTLGGEYVAKTTSETVSIVGGCTFSGSSYTGHVLFDEVVFQEA
ncbi:hypothetical protein BDV06DRAFT_226552 [Aspergillus oleicola]